MSVTSTPSNTAKLLRGHLLLRADLPLAAELAQQISDEVNERLNDAGISAGDSVLARILLANAIMAVTSDWWAALMKVPRPETHAAAMDLLINLPIALEAETYVDPTIDPGPG